jgi:RNA recognition motif-containing protein
MFKIYVGNLSFKTTEEGLKGLFAPYASKIEIIMVKDEKTTKPRGYAFVLVADEVEGQLAISKLNGARLDGRLLIVNAGGKKGTGPSGPGRGPFGPRGNRPGGAPRHPRIHRPGRPGRSFRRGPY